ncbi:hypothetical protein KC340_g1112 [Hortaea werneckii]|nr:hypothetical protein KC342_g830 [Hortaea werneckii]KAI7107580.1 hypothetical protein KC339_g2238 [Hortaea werneckii]KAI7243644.1 hypothetical protein KC365_g2124 [Hortaea werneckii]KAI7338048.1 hypothetical protein KC340_g1112 [Hortaea werneckii]KAI7363791.1 hypothetical protein KC354_g6217 [Hortaea werneckii]
MYAVPMQVDILALLHHQQRFYNHELGRTHQVLSKLYSRLAQAEQILSEREQRALTRKDKKKQQWTKSVARVAVRKWERQQAELHEYLRQCNELIISYGQATQPPMSATTMDGGWHLPQTPWTAHLPSSPWSDAFGYPLSPNGMYSPVAANPWNYPAQPTGMGFDPNDGVGMQGSGPQYWDLSMLREREQPSPHESLADSGFHEPAAINGEQSLGVVSAVDNDPNHVYVHERLSASTNDRAVPARRRSARVERSDSRSSEKDELPCLLSSPASPTKMGAEAAGGWHQRRYSENAIQLIESRLSRSRHSQRGKSVDLVPRSSTQTIQLAPDVPTEDPETVVDENFGPAVSA